MTKAQKAERLEQIESLREIIKPGDTVYTILDHVSSSGMSRAIRIVVPTIQGSNGSSSVDFYHPNYAVGKILGLRHWKRQGREQDALVVGGCGMDMGFHLVYELSHALYGAGYLCLGKGKCPSNYHVSHKDTIQCPGTVVYNPDGPNSGHPCYWERGIGWTIPVNDNPEDEDHSRIVCPTCNGNGRLPNPEGPERFDLVHTDGYALRHRWL